MVRRHTNFFRNILTSDFGLKKQDFENLQKSSNMYGGANFRYGNSEIKLDIHEKMSEFCSRHGKRNFRAFPISSPKNILFPTIRHTKYLKFPLLMNISYPPNFDHFLGQFQNSNSPQRKQIGSDGVTTLDASPRRDPLQNHEIIF